MKQEKERLGEIEEFFRSLEKRTEKYRKYFATLATLPQEPSKKRTFSEYSNSSVPRGEIKDARLEPDLKRN